MSATVILGPAAAVEAVAHDEQLRIWAHDHIMGALSLGDYLRDDLTYDDGVELEQTIKRELKRIIEMAFAHPAARTIVRR